MLDKSRRSEVLSLANCKPPIRDVAKPGEWVAGVTPTRMQLRLAYVMRVDYILEERCIGSGNRSTRYADLVYEHFGAHSLKSLMRNLAELDWRRCTVDRVWQKAIASAVAPSQR
jgi:hypothetical protein